MARLNVNKKKQFLLTRNILISSLLLLQLNGFLMILILWQKTSKENISFLFENFKKNSRWAQRQQLQKQRKQLRKPRTVWHKNGRTDAWWQNMINDILPVEEWKKNFRMSKPLFLELANELRPFILPSSTKPNFRFVNTEKKLAVVLYYLKDMGSLSMTANTFGLHISTVSKTIKEVCTAITYKLGPKYIKLPKSKEEMLRKVAEFESKFGMIQAFGCIDGTHVPLKRPTEHSQDYFCYKFFFP